MTYGYNLVQNGCTTNELKIWKAAVLQATFTLQLNAEELCKAEAIGNLKRAAGKTAEQFSN